MAGHNPCSNPDLLWELSSPSEAAMAAALLAVWCLTHCYREQARSHSGFSLEGSDVFASGSAWQKHYPCSNPELLWELSSPSEAAMAAALLAVWCLTHCYRGQARSYSGFSLDGSDVFASGPLWQEHNACSDPELLWDLSSPGEAAMAAAWLALLWLTHRYREQARSHRGFSLDGSDVLASGPFWQEHNACSDPELLWELSSPGEAAMAAAWLALLWLTHRYREQARLYG